MILLRQGQTLDNSFYQKNSLETLTQVSLKGMLNWKMPHCFKGFMNIYEYTSTCMKAHIGYKIIIITQPRMIVNNKSISINRFKLNQCFLPLIQFVICMYTSWLLCILESIASLTSSEILLRIFFGINLLVSWFEFHIKWNH